MDKAKLTFKVLDKQATDSEIAELNAWISANEGNRSEYDSLKLLWENSQGSLGDSPDASHEEGFLRIKAAIRKVRHRRKRNHLVVFGVLGFAILMLAYPLISMFSPANGRLREAIKFDSTSLGQVVAVLEKEYDVEIEVTENLLDCKFTGSFYNDSPEQTIKVIAECLKANYTIGIDRSFRIDGSGCNEESKN